MTAANRAKRISEGWSAAKAQWEADKCSKHFSYKLKGKAGVFGSVVSLFGSFLMFLSILLLFAFFCQRGRRVAVAELRHLASLPKGVED
jgi:hypothetical protein